MFEEIVAQPHSMDGYVYGSLSKNGAIQKGKTKKIIVQFFFFNGIV